MNRISYNLKAVSIILILISIYSCNTTSRPEWEVRNNELIKEYGLNVRELPNQPSTGINPNLDVGTAKNLQLLDNVELYDGVTAKIFWGKENLVSILELAPNITIPNEKLTTDRFLIVMEGTINLKSKDNNLKMISKNREEPDGTHSGTPRMDIIFQKKGSDSEIAVGDKAAKVMEVYNPIRLDYLEKIGITDLPSEIQERSTSIQATIVPNTVYDFYDIQLTQIKKGVFTRLVSAGNMQLSFVSADPNAESQAHIHPEEQITLLLRGSLTKTVVDKKLNLEPKDIAFVPGNMVHANIAGDTGFDALEIFNPIREDYIKKQQALLEKYYQIIPKDAQLKLLIDGAKTKPNLTFSEGPKWMNGKLYFSNMYFDQNWNADPKKSTIVAMEADGTYTNIIEGKMQANGLYPYKNGNLLVCDMIGHRVVEMTTSGVVVRVIADSYNGKPIDGPNDIITDSKGGIYFTDPQFTMETEKFQPGRSVYYISPDKKVIRLLEPNEFAMPNGILLSPDGKTLYINNCYDDETWYPINSSKENFVWAYDVNDDGTIFNGRKFAELRLTGNVLDRKGKSSSADGMAIDTMGNIYVATYLGVQIFDNQGNFTGVINLPSFPVSLGFGGEDMKTLYIVSYDKIYEIPTHMKGYVNYL
ncbi:SMP-30/gluconolactonase/LRE family protein [Maribacter confluentis]|uniref:SMP-30/gluconolactonase/LRE family protein n=1 Tax=Maribacter confluentis TaxID=1656093 RepID=A0ABT8RL54_9FLAO|nr:SMP-30/gluconolactonase/LRE family protein [Maribacter confluentis]MDO1511670.1 SMP-30/gluconolactonase/LRE family protein [Maribacter confluentis]